MGPKRKKALLKAFGSFAALRSATLDEIKQTGAVPAQVSEDVYAVLRAFESEKSKSKLLDDTGAPLENVGASHGNDTDATEVEGAGND